MVSDSVVKMCNEAKEVDTFTCERCSHYSICMVRMNISEFMAQHFQNDKPFEVSELAKICGSFDPIMKLTFEQ